MRICLICKEEKEISLFNEEHIIPAAIGGNFTINNVCTICNSHLGKTIDNPLLKNAAILHYRKVFGLARYTSGTIPNPFKGTHMDSDGNKYLADYKNGKLTTQSLEQFEIKNLPNNEGASGKLTIPVEKLEKKDEIIKKYLKRHGVKSEEYTVTNFEKSEPNTMVEIKAEMNHNSFIFGCVKIAYETINLLFPNAVNDPEIDLIRQFLKTGELKDSLKKAFDSGSELYTFYTKKLATIEHLSLNHHLILVEYLDGIGLVCLVRLFNLIYPTVLSTVYRPINSGYEIVFFNDCLSNVHGTNITHSIIDTSIQIDLNEATSDIKQQIKASDADIFKFDGKTPIYNSWGQIIYEDIHVFGTALLSNPRASLPWTAQNIKFELDSQKYFLRVPDKTLLPLLSITLNIGVNLQKLPVKKIAVNSYVE